MNNKKFVFIVHLAMIFKKKLQLVDVLYYFERKNSYVWIYGSVETYKLHRVTLNLNVNLALNICMLVYCKNVYYNTT